MEDVKLIKCPVCGKDVSNAAVSCPNCGHPISNHIDNTNINDVYSKNLQIDYKGIEENIANRKKKKKTKTVVCVVFFFFILFSLANALLNAGKISTNNVVQDNNMRGDAEKYIGVTKEQGEKIDVILAQCGLTNIKAIQHDELLDNIDFEGEKGYRVEANGIKNIILYLYADNVVYSIRYADRNLFLKGDSVATLGDYLLTEKEELQWIRFCKNGVNTVLKAPSTAKFAKDNNWAFKKEKNIVTIQGYVDSQNGFGAMVRSEFQFIVDANTDTIQSFIFDGEELIK